MDERTNRIRLAALYIKGIIGDETPVAGIVLGSGLGRLAEQIEDSITIPYCDIPYFPISTAVGHKGNFIVGCLGGRRVIAMQGRFHYYEGYEMEKVTIGVRTMKMLGIQYLFVSNAAGSCNPDFKVGDLMIIKDHINMMPNPLVGPNFDEFGTRFPDMTCAYDLELQKAAKDEAARMKLELKEGVYCAGTGPTYETPAEVRFFRAVGADALGMSTVPEVIVARHCGLKVFGMSVITNQCNTENVEKNLNDSDDVVNQANTAAEKLSELFGRLISRLPQNGSRG